MAFVAPIVAGIASIGPELGAVGSAVSAAGTVLGGISASESASYNAQVAANNAQVAKQNATYSLEAGETKEQLAGEEQAGVIGAAKTALAANNTDVNSGSAVDVLSGLREKGELSEEDIKNNSELEAYGYNTQATSFEAQSALDKAQSEEAIPGALIGATGSLLSNASSLGAKWTNGTGGSSTPATVYPTVAQDQP